MKRLIFGFILTVLGIFISVPVNAATNDFTISSYDIQMMLGRDKDGRSTLSVKEMIEAEFPNYDQNHGLERAFVKNYDGHNVSLRLKSVTDAQGNSLPYHWSDDNLRIGDADKYVHGTQTYVIEYTMRDVTRYFEDTGRDEFYWDVIGGDWQVPITNASVNLTLEPDVLAARTGDAVCYRGTYKSTDSCLLSETASGYTLTAENLATGEGMTVAIGFNRSTFGVYQPSLFEKLFDWWVILQTILLPVGLGIGIWLAVKFSRLVNRRKEFGTIVPEYLPPEYSVTTAARVGGYVTSIMTAQLLDLAVKHYIKLHEVKEKTLFSAAEYEIEVVRDVKDLRVEERELLQDLFGTLPNVGDTLNLKALRSDTKYFARTLNNDADLDKLIRGEYNLRFKDEQTRSFLKRTGLVLLAASVATLSPLLFVVGLAALISTLAAWTLTDEGLALRRHLEGLKMYIEVAEEERIKMLQSPEGAAKTKVSPKGNDNAQLIHLYERVLPYAVLFGQEKQWGEQLGRYYEKAGQQPDWYSGHSAVFNAAMFSSAINNFSTTSSYVSSSSSSSGGSGGGGFSGGGGGGGGGGGW